MVKLLCSFVFISCLILISGNVIPNHINNIGSNNALNTVNNASTEPKANPYDLCLKNCKETNGKLCKYNCEARHIKRQEQDKYDDCMKKCSASAMGEAQSPGVCECRSGCDKAHPKNMYVW